MRFTVAALARSGVASERVHASMERNMQCGIGHCGHCQLGPTLVCREGPVYRGASSSAGSRSGSYEPSTRPRQTLAVWKFASCDGCQLSLLDCEDELLALAERLQIAYFLEATSAQVAGPLRPVHRRGLDHDAA